MLARPADGARMKIKTDAPTRRHRRQVASPAACASSHRSAELPDTSARRGAAASGMLETCQMSIQLATRRLPRRARSCLSSLSASRRVVASAGQADGDLAECMMRSAEAMSREAPVAQPRACRIRSLINGARRGISRARFLSKLISDSRHR